MPATTPRGFPYPLPTEPVAEGAQAIRNLAEAIDAKDAGHELAYVEKTTDTALGTSPTLIVTAPAVSLDGLTRICAEFFCPAWAFPATSINTFLELWDAKDGAAAAKAAQIGGLTNSQMLGGTMIAHTAYYFTPAAGSHVYSARGWCNASSCTCRGGTGLAGAIVPVFLRLTKA